jgi:two-component system NtrC family sensor kinase
LRKDNVVLGSFYVGRRKLRPFAKKEIALVQNFAAQAVIAMENARLLTETREALEQQTATTEVLQVINSSPGDLAPVFEAMLEKAMRLCEAPAGYLLRYEAGRHFLAAGSGLSDELARFLAHMPQPKAHEAPIRILEGAPYVHINDLKDSEAYRSGTALRRAAVDLGGLRTGLVVPLLKDGQVLGNFCLGRYEMRPFSDKQITLMQNFAVHAVIAVENARLINETREALEQQTATADVLKIISRSRFELQSVLDTLLETAAQLCKVEVALMYQRDGENYRGVACFGLPTEWRDFIENSRRTETWVYGPDRGSVVGRVALEGKVVQVQDLASNLEYTASKAVQLGRVRTVIGVPLLREGEPTGVFCLAPEGRTLYRAADRAGAHVRRSGGYRD